MWWAAFSLVENCVILHLVFTDGCLVVLMQTILPKRGASLQPSSSM